MGKSKYWNWCGDDPMPKVAERYYDLLEEVNNSFPEELWDADKVPGVESGRYWGYVSVYHICHDGPEDIHLDIDTDDKGRGIISLCSLADNGAKNFWDFPKRVYMKYRVPNKVLMDRDFAFNILVLFAGAKKGYRKEMAKFIADNGGITSTSLEGEKMARQLKETTSEHKDDLDEIELTAEDIDKYIPYRNEIQDILEKEGLAENRTNSSGEEQLVQVSQAEEIFSAGCEYVLKLLKRNGELK